MVGAMGTASQTANGMLMWVSCNDVAEMTEAQLAYWHALGVGGFVCQTGWLWGLGGQYEFDGNPGANLSASQYSLQREFVASQVVANAHALGMRMYLGFYASNYFDTQTPFGEWFDDGTWAGTVLPAVSAFASGAHELGFDGVALDEELYPQIGGVQTATWAWDYPDNTHSEAQVRAEAVQRGSQMMGALVNAFPNIEIVDTATNFPGTWSAYEQTAVNGVVDPYEDDVQLDFWNGMTSVDGYSAIRFLDESLYKGPNVPGASWTAALSYDANSWFALMSRSFRIGRTRPIACSSPHSRGSMAMPLKEHGPRPGPRRS